MKTLLIIFCLILLVHYESCHAGPIGNDLGSRRCVNMWDEGCINGQLPGSGDDDDYLNGGFNPGKRCLSVWDEGCNNGQLSAPSDDDNHLESFTLGRHSLAELLAKLRKKYHFY